MRSSSGRRRTAHGDAVVAGPAVPLRAPCGDREVGPAVGHAERVEVDVRGERAVVTAKRVRGTGVAVADDEPVDRRRRPGPRAAAARGKLSTDRSKGHASTGSASWSARRPRPIAAAAVVGSSTRRGSTADRPGTGFGDQPAAVRARAEIDHGGQRRPSAGPGQTLRLGAEVDLGRAGGGPFRVAGAARLVEAEGQPAHLVAPHRRDPVAVPWSSARCIGGQLWSLCAPSR